MYCYVMEHQLSFKCDIYMYTVPDSASTTFCLNISNAVFLCGMYQCRFLMNKVGTKLSRMMLFGFGFHWIRVRGRPATTEEAPILIVAPHTSLLDVFIIAAGYCNIPTFVAKEDFKHVPFFGCKSAWNVNM